MATAFSSEATVHQEPLIRNITIKIPALELEALAKGNVLKLDYTFTDDFKLAFALLLPSALYKLPAFRITIQHSEIEVLLKGQSITHSFNCVISGQAEVIKVLISKKED